MKGFSPFGEDPIALWVHCWSIGPLAKVSVKVRLSQRAIAWDGLNMRIGLFIPCFIDAFFPEVGIATLELLERLGHEVVYPRDQTCCGQPLADGRLR